jgi:ribosomal protein S18 acetylase RimI-like enzyme
MPEMITRWKMRAVLAEQPVTETWLARSIVPDDAPMLGRLMYDAYHGAIDDEGETDADAEAMAADTLGGRLGPLLAAASLVIEEQGKALGATIITDWTDGRTWTRQPLLAFLMVHPTAAGRGMGAYLLRRSMNALLAAGEHELALFVTVGNAPAQHIYQTLGFQVEEEFETDRVKSE